MSKYSPFTPNLFLDLSDQSLSGTLTSHFESGLLLRKQCQEAIHNNVLTASRAILNCYQNGGKILLAGNGGSAADAQHLAAEFVGRFTVDRRSLPAIALTSNSSTVTAVGNDYGYEKVFSRQVEGLGQPGDVLVAISTSGNSENLVDAINVARDLDVVAIALSGKTGGHIAELADVAIVIPSQETALIQEMHITVGHALCHVIEAALIENQAGHQQTKAA